MKRTTMTLLAGAALLAGAGTSGAALISPTTATLAAGSLLGGSAALIVDGTIPPEGQNWQLQTAYWGSSATILRVDLGALYRVEDVVVSVDNNDAYRVRWSSDGSAYTTLFDIAVGYGEIANGVDTMSSELGNPEYIAGIDFAPVVARYLEIAASGGDSMYSVGELQAYGSVPVPVPAPLAALLFLPLLAARAATGRRTARR
jgi:hypothetical protein